MVAAVHLPPRLPPPTDRTQVTEPTHSTVSRKRTTPAPGAKKRLQQARAVSASSPLVTAKEAAELLGVPDTWLLSQARAKRIPHHKLGHYVRFDLEQLILWLDETRIEPKPR